MPPVVQRAGVHHIAVGGVERKDRLARRVVDRHGGAIPALERHQRHLPRVVQRSGEHRAAALAAHVAHQPVPVEQKNRLPPHVVDRGAARTGGHRRILQIDDKGKDLLAARVEQQDARLRDREERVVQHRVRGAAVALIAERLRPAVGVLRHLVVGEEPSQAVHAADVPERGEGHHAQHRQQHQQQDRHTPERAALLRRRVLCSASLFTH